MFDSLKSRQKKKAIMGNVIAAIVVSMMLTLGVYLSANFNKNLDTTGLDSAAIDAINKTQQNTYSGFKLGSVIPTVLFAAVMIGAIGYFASKAM